MRTDDLDCIFIPLSHFLFSMLFRCGFVNEWKTNISILILILNNYVGQRAYGTEKKPR